MELISTRHANSGREMQIIIPGLVNQMPACPIDVKWSGNKQLLRNSAGPIHPTAAVDTEYELPQIHD